MAALAATTPVIPAAAQTTVTLPFRVGVRLPTYDRVDGLTIPFGPVVSLAGSRLLIDPVIAYRSHLGKLDPRVALTLQRPDSSLALLLRGERGTFTNERWVRGDIMNSLVTLGFGRDARNYFRADRGDALVQARVPGADGSVYAFAGGRLERAWSTGWRAGDDRAPFSLLGRGDTLNGIARPNAEIDRGRIGSLLAGARAAYDGVHGAARADLTLERGRLERRAPFTQLTANAVAALPTTRGQRLVLRAHLLTTGSAVAPRQRWSYAGGSGTVPTMDLLARGGDHLWFVDTWYEVPVPRADLPLVGQPWIAPRAVAGSAAVGGYGRPVRNLGVRLGATIFYADFLVDPATRERVVSAGITLPH